MLSRIRDGYLKTLASFITNIKFLCLLIDIGVNKCSIVTYGVYIYIYIYIHKNYIYIFKKLESFKNALLGDAPNVMGKPKGIPLHLGWQIK